MDVVSQKAERNMCSTMCAVHEDFWQHKAVHPPFCNRFKPAIEMYIIEFSTVKYTIRYGLEGSGFEFLLGARFSAPVHTDTGAQAASTMDRVASPGVKRPGRGVDHPPQI
jgi:hypothetical protein